MGHALPTSHPTVCSYFITKSPLVQGDLLVSVYR
jgi:hypothetical protein